MSNENIVQKLWHLCHILRGDGISYHGYISELTYLLFLKITEETGTDHLLPRGYRWRDLASYEGEDLLFHYQEMLTHLGGRAASDVVRQIYAFPTTVFSHSVNLRAVIDGIGTIDWHSIEQDRMGDLYEGLLAKNSEDARSGAGQYFTPRPLVDCIVSLVKPQLTDRIQDPAAGSGGFLIAADHYIRTNNSEDAYNTNKPQYQGVEIERDTHRICLMNTFLHQMEADIIFGDALTEDAKSLSPADLILGNPPFGAKAGSVRKARSDLPFPSTNKQLAFLQHAVHGLRPGGRAAVVMPDNVLFEDGVGRQVRHHLLECCDLHTILRLPTGIYYSQGVKTNVLFFTKGRKDGGNTSAVWMYDLRTNMPAFNKRNPFTRAHLESFKLAYGADPLGQDRSIQQDGDNRLRCFAREEIAERDELLDLIWLKDERTATTDVGASLNDLSAELVSGLQSALEEVQALSETLESRE